MEYRLANYEKEMLDQQHINIGELYLSSQSDYNAACFVETAFAILELMCEYNMVALINDKIKQLINFTKNHFKKEQTFEAKELLANTYGRAGDIKKHIDFLTLAPTRDYDELYEKSFRFYSELHNTDISNKSYRVGLSRGYLRRSSLRAFGNSLHYILQAQMVAYDDSCSLTDDKGLLQEIHLALACKYFEPWAIDDNFEMAKEHFESVQSFSKELYGSDMSLSSKRNFARSCFLYGNLLKKENNNNQKAYRYYDTSARLYLEIYDKTPTPRSCFDWGMACYNIATFDEETIDNKFLDKAHFTLQKLVNDYPDIKRYKELYKRIKILRFSTHPPF